MQFHAFIIRFQAKRVSTFLMEVVRLFQILVPNTLKLLLPNSTWYKTLLIVIGSL